MKWRWRREIDRKGRNADKGREKIGERRVASWLLVVWRPLAICWLQVVLCGRYGTVIREHSYTGPIYYFCKYKTSLVCNRQKCSTCGGFVAHHGSNRLSSVDCIILSASARLRKFVTNDPLCCIFRYYGRLESRMKTATWSFHKKDVLLVAVYSSTNGRRFTIWHIKYTK